MDLYILYISWKNINIQEEQKKQIIANSKNKIIIDDLQKISNKIIVLHCINKMS